MLTDASYKLVTAKFSFIEQLNRSRLINDNQPLNSVLLARISQIIGKELSLPPTSEILEFSSQDDYSEKDGEFQQPAPESSPSLVLSTSFINGIGSESTFNNSLSSSLSLDLEEDWEFSTATASASPPRKRHFDKILFALSCGYLMFVIGWLLHHTQNRFDWWFADLGSQQQASPEDIQFINYLQRSLEVIDRKVQAQQTEQVDRTAKDQLTPPKVVYVPIYTPSPATASPLLSPVAQSYIPPQPIPPPPPPSELVTEENLAPVATSSTNIQPQTTESSNTTIAATSTPASTPDYTLVGLLELGNESAALFKVNDTTQRIWLGEKVGDSGWILKSISNQQATVSLGDQVRSLSIGEKF